MFRRALLALLCLLTATVACAQTLPATGPTTTTAPARTGPPPGSKAVVIGYDDVVDEFPFHQLRRRLADAKADGADAVILHLKTPGGLVGVALDFSRTLKTLDDLYVVVLVDEFAYSAGALISVAADEITMEPGSVIGDSGVILGSGDSVEGETERAKMESPVMEEFRASASLRGYPQPLVDAMVQVKRTVHFVENPATGAREIVDGPTFTRRLAEGWRTVPGVRDPIDDETTILTLNADIAQKIGLSTATVASPEALAQQRGWTVIATHRPGSGERLAGFLTGYTVRGLMLTGLIAATLLAVKIPGTGLAESAAVACLGMLIVIPLVTGYASWAEVLLITVGIGLIALELFVIPGFGVAGLAGGLALLMGIALTFLPPVTLPGVPSVSFPLGDLARATLTMTLALLAACAAWLALAPHLYKLPIARRLVLDTVAGAMPAAAEPLANAARRALAAGDRGVAVSDLRPGGAARLVDQSGEPQLYDVVSDRGFVVAGAEIVVREIEGTRVVVRPVAGGAA